MIKFILFFSLLMKLMQLCVVRYRMQIISLGCYVGWNQFALHKKIIHLLLKKDLVNSLNQFYMLMVFMLDQNRKEHRI